MSKAGLLLHAFGAALAMDNQQLTKRIPLGHGTSSKELKAKRKRERQARRDRRRRGV